MSAGIIWLELKGNRERAVLNRAGSSAENDDGGLFLTAPTTAIFSTVAIYASASRIFAFLDGGR